MQEAESHIAPLIASFNHIADNHSPHPQLSPPKPQPLILVTMGSDTDLPTLKAGLDILDRFAIPFEAHITSAHRTPDYMVSTARAAADRGIRVIIAAAGGAAHLPGMIASETSLPVIGVPVKASVLDGVDSLYSIIQMPRGTPVATVGIGNSTNAALLAARILGITDERIREKVEGFMKANEQESLGKDERLVELGYKRYLEDVMAKK
jgi:phosphoribosylaminoimidazole carboxylase